MSQVIDEDSAYCFLYECPLDELLIEWICVKSNLSYESYTEYCIFRSGDEFDKRAREKYQKYKDTDFKCTDNPHKESV